MLHSRGFVWGSLCFIVLASFLVSPGYESGVGDQAGYYLPQLFQSMHPERYGDDMLYRVQQTDYSLYDELVVMLMRAWGVDVYTILLVFSVLFRMVVAGALYAVGRYVTGSRGIALMWTALVLWVPTFVFGLGIRVLDPHTEARLVAFALGMSAMAWYMYRHTLLAYVCTTGALLLHLPSALVFLCFLYGSTGYDIYKNGDWKRFGTRVAMMMPVIAFAILLYISDSGDASFSLLQTVDVEWRTLMQAQLPSVFFSSWGVAGLLTLGAGIVSGVALCATVYTRMRERPRALLLIACGTPIALALLMFIAVDILHLHSAVAIQPLRGLALFKILLVLLALAEFVQRVRRNPGDRFGLFFIAFFAFVIVFNERWLPLATCVLLLDLLGRYGGSMRGYVPNALNQVFGYIVSHAIMWSKGVFGCMVLFSLCAYLFEDVVASILGAPPVRIEALPVGFALATVSAGVAVLAVHYVRMVMSRAVLVACGMLLIVFSLFMGVDRVAIYPRIAHSEEMALLCGWVQDTTNPEDLFLIRDTPSTDGYVLYLRTECGVSFYVAGEGGQSVFDRAYAVEFATRKSVKQMLVRVEQGFVDAAYRAGVSYVVTVDDMDAFFGTTPVFHAEPVRVYRLDMVFSTTVR